MPNSQHQPITSLISLPLYYLTPQTGPSERDHRTVCCMKRQRPLAHPPAVFARACTKQRPAKPSVGEPGCRSTQTFCISQQCVLSAVRKPGQDNLGAYSLPLCLN